MQTIEPRRSATRCRGGHVDLVTIHDKAPTNNGDADYLMLEVSELGHDPYTLRGSCPEIFCVQNIRAPGRIDGNDYRRQCLFILFNQNPGRKRIWSIMTLKYSLWY